MKIRHINRDGLRIVLDGDKVTTERDHVEHVVTMRPTLDNRVTCIRCRRALDSAAHKHRCSTFSRLP
jgi:hypothetical protein